MPSLNIPEDTFRQLAVRARALNISVEDLVRPVLEQLTKNGSRAPASGGQAPTLADRKLAFEEWTKHVESRADRYPPGHVLDDSRESIYREREDKQL